MGSSCIIVQFVFARALSGPDVRVMARKKRDCVYVVRVGERYIDNKGKRTRNWQEARIFYAVESATEYIKESGLGYYAYTEARPVPPPR